MRRESLVEAIERVRNAVVSSKTEEVLQILMRSGEKRAASSAVFEAYAKFMVEYTKFGANEKFVMRQLKIEEIASSEFWTKLVTADTNTRPSGDIFELRWGLNFLKEHIPGFLSLLHRDSDTADILFETPDGESKKQLTTKRLKFFVREPDAPSLTVKQMVEILNSIDELFAAVLKIYNIGQSELVVGSLDSGSDKSLDIIGIAEGISKLSELLLQGWDKYRFAKSAKLSANFKSAGDGLTLLEQLKEAENKKTVSPEESEKLRRTVIKNIDALFSNGVYTDAMEQRREKPPSQIAVERRKLITHIMVEQKPASGKRGLGSDDEDRGINGDID